MIENIQNQNMISIASIEKFDQISHLLHASYIFMHNLSLLFQFLMLTIIALYEVFESIQFDMIVLLSMIEIA